MMVDEARASVLILLLAGVLLGVPGPAPLIAQEDAQSPDQVSESYGSWMLRCGAARTDCRILQELVRAEDGARLVRVTVFRGEDDGLLLRVLTPLGAHLDSGVSLLVDEAELPALSYDSCWQAGCVAQRALTAGLETALREGEALAVSVVGADTGQAVRFELALNGFTRALDRMLEK